MLLRHDGFEILNDDLLKLLGFIRIFVQILNHGVN